MKLFIPGFKDLQVTHLMLDYNGTLACDGRLLAGVQEVLKRLAEEFEIHIVTGNTHGDAESHLRGIPCTTVMLGPEEGQVSRKAQYLEDLGPNSTVCIGNGRNDRFMLERAVLGIVVAQEEGAAVEALQAADVVCPNILSALSLLTEPKRLIATLRS